jgi:hypothetical protein
MEGLREKLYSVFFNQGTDRAYSFIKLLTEWEVIMRALIYAMMLSAAVSGRQVSYYIVGCDAHGFPELRHALVNF